ncbi:MAG: hypothetical protein P8J20_13205 [Novosphingobium sp.]|nr:hypothetical protein [Novosphingobium sp.]
MNAPANAAQEWRQFWYLSLVAAVGYSTAVLHTYGVGPFIGPIQREFGWNRASISLGIMIAGLTGACLSGPMGMLVDRFGPCFIGLIGAVVMPSAFALLGTATGSLTTWYLLWGFVAFANLWFLAVFPPALFFFRGAQDKNRQQHDKPPAHATEASVDVPGASIGEALRTTAFYKLQIVSVLFTFTNIGIIVHFVPILTDQGATPLRAAGIAWIVGISSIIWPLGTGVLLDRIPGHMVGASIFLLPVIAATLLLSSGSNPLSQIIASGCFGFTVGAEVDVIACLDLRHFGLRSYGVLFGAMAGGLVAGTALGPLTAEAAFDTYGSYSQFFLSTVVLMVISCLVMTTLKTRKSTIRLCTFPSLTTDTPHPPISLAL